MALEAERQTLLPTQVGLDPGAPNPFNAVTRLRFGVPRETRVKLEIYDVHGAHVRTLIDGARVPAGYRTVLWDGTSASGRAVASGVYFCRLEAIGIATTRRLVVLK